MPNTTTRPTRAHLEPEQLQDSVARHLYADQTLTDDQRADLYDITHGAKSTAELAQHLNTMPISPKLKENLLAAKDRAFPPAAMLSHADKVMAAIHHMTTIPKDALEIAETHPQILKHLTADITQGKE